jgi:uncharacterized protein YggE
MNEETQMSRRSLVGVTVVTALLAAAPAAAQSIPSTQAKSVTATGTGQARVVPTNRHSNASIVAAVSAAHVKAIGGALRQAHEYAVDYAQASGLTLGDALSVSDTQTQTNGWSYGPGYGSSFGPFGANRYCGTTQQVVGRPVKGHRPKIRKVHRCFVPALAYTTLTVTYSAS